jgi:microcompartment protein CcmK/EutM
VLLGRVVGRVVATQRLPGLHGEKLLIVQPLDEQRAAAGDTLVACDAVGSGLGDIVHVCDGREATLALRESYVPIDATIVGHVEEFAHDGPGPQVDAGRDAGPGADSRDATERGPQRTARRAPHQTQADRERADRKEFGS